jgi:hypothetical protein
MHGNLTGNRACRQCIARLDKDMAYDAPNQLVECPRDERGESHGSDVARHVSVLQREPLSWTNWLVPVTVSVLGAAAVGVVVSAITVASRQRGAAPA